MEGGMRMADREKVIEILEKAKTIIEEWIPMFEQYNTPAGIDEAIALLKEQETVEPFHKCKGKSFSLIEDNNYDYCPYCGKPITWAKQEGR